MFHRRRTLKPEERFTFSLFVLIVFISFAMTASWSQATISTGSIQGTVTDPSGAVVPDAKVTITNKATGQKIELTTNQSGAYHSGTLTPGNYTVRIAAKTFRTVELPVVVQVGVVTPGNVKLTLGSGRPESANTLVQ